MSAYGCDPAGGSEPGAGWGFAVAAARHADVWVFAHPRWEPAVSAVLERDPDLAAHLHMVYAALGPTLSRLRRRPADVYWYYFLWQRRIGRLAVELHREVGFDVAHHVTFANDWMPVGLDRLRDVPLVWGPVGAASRMPIWRLRRWLGRRGLAVEVLRSTVTEAVRRVYADPAARRASLVVAQNDEVARRFDFARSVVVEPNAALDPVPASSRTGEPGTRTALFVGRLIHWKGVRLAVHVIAHPLASDWHLTFVGEGPERAEIERLAQALGVSDRVDLTGHLPREEVMDRYATADALLFPSFRDAAGWVVAEASSAGCPVVCLPLGGPPTLAHVNAFVAPLDGDVVENLARQLVRAGEQGGTPHDRWARDRLPGLVDEWYKAATSGTSASPHRRRRP
jgi:glycosyltransferase involved in cell wall biosynthesis